MFVLRSSAVAAAARRLCLAVLLLSLLPANPVQASAVSSVPAAAAPPNSVPTAPKPSPGTAAATAMPALPVRVTVHANRAVLAAGKPAQVTVRVAATGSGRATALPPVDVTLTLPDGLATADGRSGVLTWSGVRVGHGAAFVQRFAVRPAGGNTGLNGQKVLKLAAAAAAPGYAPADGELLVGLGSATPAANAQVDSDGALVESADGAVALLAPAGVLPEGSSLHITELFDGDAPAPPTTPPATPTTTPTATAMSTAVATAVPAQTATPAPATDAAGDAATVGAAAAATPAPAVPDTTAGFQLHLPSISNASSGQAEAPTSAAAGVQPDAGWGELTGSALAAAVRQDANLQAVRIFQLDAAVGNQKATFSGEVQLRINLAPWLARGVDINLLRLWTREQPSESWHPVLTGYDPEQQTLVAWLPHFSQFGLGAGLDSSGDLLPSVKAFTVDTLNGGASLHLPVNTPKGLGGLTPNVSFDYSSILMDDMLRVAGEQEIQTQASSVGLGWTLSGVNYIARADDRIDRSDAAKEFALVLNGSRTAIVFQGGRWRTNPETFARVVWHRADRDHDNGSGYTVEDYDGWSVFTPDGLHYEFGDAGVFSGSFVSSSPTATFLSKSPSGQDDIRLAKRWYLRKVSDPLGNSMEYHYYAEMANQSGCVGDDWRTKGRNWYTRSMDPTEILYSGNPSQGVGYSLRVLFSYNPADRADTQVKGNKEDDCLQPMFAFKNQLTAVTVQVLQQGSWQTLTTYNLGQSVASFSYPELDDTQNRLLLAGLTQSGKNGVQLSGYSFTYDADTAGANTTVLASADNGVGGRVTYNYDYYRTSCANSTCPAQSGNVGTNQRHAVTRTQARDELNNSVYTDYFYGPPNDPGHEWSAVADDGGFLGFQEVDTTYFATNSLDPNTALKWEKLTAVEGGSGVDASRKNPDPRRGKPARLEVWSRNSGNNGQLLMTTDYDWRAYWLEGNTYGSTLRTSSWYEQNGNVYFPATVVQQHAVTQTVWTSAGAPTSGKVYRYENEYGNVTDVEEWADGVKQRTTHTDYYPKHTWDATGDTTGFIADHPARVRVYDAAGVCRSEVRSVYDRYDPTANNYQTAPVKGLLSERDQAFVSCAEAATVATNDPAWQVERFAYDAYGNQITHHKMAASDGSRDQYITTDYDTVYHLFPIRRFDEAQQTAAYYGVNAISSGESKALDDPYAYWGSLAEWCDVNEVCVRQAYDEQGRRRLRWDNVARGATWSSLSESNAGVRWDYRDPLNYPTWNDTTITEWHAPRCEGNFVRRHYNAFGLLTQEQRPAQGWGVAYDGCGVDVAPEPEVDVDYAYDALGRQTAASAPHAVSGDWVNREPDWSAYTATAYDALGRVTLTSAPNGEQTVYEYAGRQTKVVGVGRNGDANKVLKWTETDGLGRLAIVRTGDSSGNETARVTLTHDALDNLVRVDQPVGTTTLTYDLAGRKTQLSDPDLGTWSYTYWRNGLLRRQVDACGNTTTLGYNGVEQVTSKTLSAGTACAASTLPRSYSTIYYTYGANHSATNRSRGQLTAVVYANDALQKTLTYNAKGQLASEKVVIGTEWKSYTTQYGYDAYDRPRTTTYPDGEVVSTAYNSLGLADGITTTQGVTVTNLVSAAAYDAAGRLVQVSLPAANTWVNWSYAPWQSADGNGNGRLLGIAAGTTPGGSDVMAVAYAYDTYGNPTHQAAAGSGNPLDDATYAFDDQNRLTGEVQALAVGSSRDYGWEAAGRLRSLGAAPLTYDGLHPHAADTVAGVDRYDYNANGNMVVRKKGQADQQTLLWDVENRLARVSSSGALTETYQYDENGQLIRKQVGSVITYYPIPGFEQTNGVNTKTYFFNNQAVAVRTGSGLSYLYHDRVGSTIHVTNQSGGYVASRGYYAFGETRRSDGAMPSDRRYTGQPESATGLYYYGARWYDPAIGQFVSPDTIIPDESSFLDYNRYLYARGNPLKYNDPSGHCPTDAPSGDDEKASTEFRECWTLAGQIAAMYDSDSWWQDRFKVDRDTFVTKVATSPIADSKWLALQLTAWSREFEQRTGLPTGKIDWHEPINLPVNLPGSPMARAVADDFFACQDNFPWGCSNLADDGALLVAGGAVVTCTYATGGGCLVVGGWISTAVSASGTLVTTGNAVNGNATPVDAVVSWATLVGGAKFGTRANGLVGAGTGAVQRLYDWWASQQ